MRPIALTIVIGLIAVPSRADEPPRPEELKALELFLGDWKVEGVHKPAEWTPKGFTFTGTDSIRWTLKDRFLVNNAVNETLQIEMHTLIGYDSARKVYTTHFFNSQGVAVTSQGKFDPKTKTFTWTSEEGGIVFTSQHHFVEDRIEGFFLAKDKAGKVYMDMTFKNTRKK